MVCFGSGAGVADDVVFENQIARFPADANARHALFVPLFSITLSSTRLRCAAMPSVSLRKKMPSS